MLGIVVCLKTCKKKKKKNFYHHHHNNNNNNKIQLNFLFLTCVQVNYGDINFNFFLHIFHVRSQDHPNRSLVCEIIIVINVGHVRQVN